MNFYNEIDPYAAQWLRNLIAAGHIPAGVVDERSIEDEAYAHGWNACRAATLRAIEQALTQQRATPQPSADTVRELVSKMYGGAVAVGSDGQWVSVRRYLLDELESLLSGGSHA